MWIQLFHPSSLQDGFSTAHASSVGDNSRSSARCRSNSSTSMGTNFLWHRTRCGHRKNTPFDFTIDCKAIRRWIELRVGCRGTIAWKRHGIRAHRCHTNLSLRLSQTFGKYSIRRQLHVSACVTEQSAGTATHHFVNAVCNNIYLFIHCYCSLPEILRIVDVTWYVFPCCI